MYPYIGEGLNSGSIVLFYEQNKGLTLESKTWASENLQYSNCINEDLFKNITADYLRNTYGKVESKEHADFLIELAGENKIKIGIGEYSERKNYFYFTEDEGLLYLVFASFYPSNNHISTTLPLPPKESEEWPKVGDEVTFSGKQVYKVVVNKPDSDNMIVVKDNMGEYVLADFSVCKKPPTPEEDLENKIRGMIEFTNYNPKAIAEYIINGEIKGLSYKPE